jgi:hypothetical protein
MHTHAHAARLIISFIDAVVNAARLESGAGDGLYVAKKHQEKETSRERDFKRHADGEAMD